MYKSADEWINMMPMALQKKIRYHVQNQHPEDFNKRLDTIQTSVGNTIIYLFNWDDTPEGPSYWNHLYSLCC
jgi:hypothetical protein